MEYGQQATGRDPPRPYIIFDSCLHEPNVLYSPEIQDYTIPILNHII